MSDYLIVTNYDRVSTTAGCVTHLLRGDKTLCGLYPFSHRGDWQETGAAVRSDNIGCQKCRKAYWRRVEATCDEIIEMATADE